MTDFSSDAGGDESEIRRWIIESDWLETIVAVPEQLTAAVTGKLDVRIEA